jgi:dCMP deaminase
MRGSWDHYFLQIALATSTRSTCPRLHVGAVIVKDRRIISTGYNGSVRGQPHCEDVGCDLVETGNPDKPHRCQRTVHAEANALLFSRSAPGGLDDAALYCTHSPCRECFKLIANAGVATVVYAEPFYRDLSYGVGLGINLVHFQGVIGK